MIEKFEIKTYGKKEILETKEYQEKILDIADKIFTKDTFINAGKTAEVFRDEENNTCYKSIDKPEKLLLDIDEEIEIADEARTVSNTVKVPAPFFSVIATVRDNKNFLKKVRFFGMELVNGPTMKDVLEGKEELPENFNFEEFFSNLTDFFEKLHKEKKIHHRDFHDENLMIDRETGGPWVIDFGHATKAFLADEDPYKEFGLKGEVIHYAKDLEEVVKMKEKLKNLIDKNEKTLTMPNREFLIQETGAKNELEKLKIRETKTFEDNIKNAAVLMKEANSNLMEIPDAGGLILVKEGSDEAKEREETDMAWYKTTVDGNTYLVCRK